MPKPGVYQSGDSKPFRRHGGLGITATLSANRGRRGPSNGTRSTTRGMVPCKDIHPALDGTGYRRGRLFAGQSGSPLRASAVQLRFQRSERRYFCTQLLTPAYINLSKPLERGASRSTDPRSGAVLGFTFRKRDDREPTFHFAPAEE